MRTVIVALLLAGCATLSPEERAAREADRKRQVREAYWRILEQKARNDKRYRAENARPIRADRRIRRDETGAVAGGDTEPVGAPTGPAGSAAAPTMGWQLQSAGGIQSIFSSDGRLMGTVNNGQIWLNNGTFGTLHGNQVWLSTGQLGYVSGNQIRLY